MDLSQVTTIVENSNYKDWLNNLEFTFENYKRPELNRMFRGITAIWQYANSQKIGWEGKPKSLEINLSQKRESVQNFCATLEQFIIIVNEEVNTLPAKKWASSVAKQNGDFVPFELPEVDFLLEFYVNYQPFYLGAYNFFFGSNQAIQNFSSRESLIGMLVAFQYSAKEFPILVDQKPIVLNDITEAKKFIEKYISDGEKQKLDFFAKAWEEKNKLELAFAEKTESSVINFDNWHIVSKQEFERLVENAKEGIKQNEKAYSELLKLKEPAEYWAKRAQELNKQGNKNLCWFIVAVSITAFALFCLLYISPDDMLESFFGNNKSRAIRWSIVFITFVSIMFIAIRTLGRMMFSAFHLARDAEERHQLTYLYLALKKDAAVDDKDRQLILQSLFSRADTGLLKDEASPTMPGIEKVITKN